MRSRIIFFSYILILLISFVFAQETGTNVPAPEGVEPEVGDSYHNYSLIGSANYNIQYKVEPRGEVHQWIAYQARFIWTTPEIDSYNYLMNNYNSSLDDNCYQNGEGILIGAGEEDYCGLLQFFNHFWNPDNPDGGNYNAGLCILCESSYVRAQRFYDKAKDLYSEGKKNEAYYYLGRVAHLLEDATVPAHVHLDAHFPDDDEYEEFTAGNHFNNAWGDGNNFKHFMGSNHSRKQYNYESIWWDSKVKNSATNLFKLFYYTAQKTQHFASDDYSGNNLLRFQNENSYRCFGSNCSNYDWLWEDTEVEIINDKRDIESSSGNGNKDNLKKVAEANVPHAMKSVAGLYRLFWVETHGLSTCGFGECCDTNLRITREIGSQPDGWSDFSYCDINKRNVYRRDYYCSGNSNTQNSVDSLLQSCQSGQVCQQVTSQRAECVIPKIQILSPLNNSIINTSDVIVRFNVSDWIVGGKGQKHVHFHIDNTQGLGFSDHLMFYNGLDKVVELNLGSGGTRFATWTNENTIRLNNLPIGRYRLRAHLANQDHSVVGNPEADTEITFNVSLCKVLSPMNNVGYNNRRVPFLVKSSEFLDEIEYIDYSERRPRWKTLCNGCSSLNKQVSFDEGLHDVSIKCTDFQGKSEEERVRLFIDSTEPRIRGTGPRRGDFTNGNNFIVEYDEDNAKYVRLFWNPNVTREDCSYGRNQECKFNINLNNFNGREIEYWFEIEDIAGNRESSRKTKVKVDTISPVINSFDYSIRGRSVDFRIEINEQNFDSVEYIDYNERSPRWRMLCSRLREGVCSVRKSFRSGEHNLKIRILDRAGNGVEREIGFEINA